jgi:hypothetical protein
MDDVAVRGIERSVGPAILLSQKCFFFGRVKTSVDFAIEVSFFVKLGQDRLDDFLVPNLGSADKIVIAQIQFCDEGFPNGGQVIAILLRAFAFGYCCLLNFLPMLIQPGQEEDFLAETSMRTRNHIGGDLLVSVAEMRLAVYVVNRCRDVKAFAHAPLLCPMDGGLATVACPKGD